MALDVGAADDVDPNAVGEASAEVRTGWLDDNLSDERAGVGIRQIRAQVQLGLRRGLVIRD